MANTTQTEARRRTRPQSVKKQTSPALGIPIILDHDIVIPPGIVDHESYRRWARSDAYPHRGRFAFFNDSIWVDLSMEQAFTHNLVKLRFGVVLDALVEQLEIGQYFTDGMQVTHVESGFTTVPDGSFITFESFETGRVVQVPSKDNIGCVEFAGTPDMVLEIVSKFSEEKDEAFINKYFQAGVPEYWLVDVRQTPIRFDLLRRSKRGYVATRTQPGGWLKSSVFGQSFRLLQSTDRLGNPKFKLEHRD